MKITKAMIDAHPLDPSCDSEKLAKAIGELYICAQACIACADACLGEKQIQTLVRCIRLNQDCADICHATGAVLSRLSMVSKDALKYQVQACAAACSLCASECEQHAGMHEHCGICAEACRRCQSECENITGLL